MVGLRVPPRLVDDAARGENIATEEFTLQPGGIDAITEFPNYVNDDSGRVGLHLRRVGRGAAPSHAEILLI